MFLNQESLMVRRQAKLRELIRSVYQLQKLRIQAGNRLCASYYYKMGLKPGQKIDEFLKQLDKAQEAESPYSEEVPNENHDLIKAKDLLVKMRKEYRLLSGGILLNHQQIKKLDFGSSGIISDEIDYLLVEIFAALITQEEKVFKHLENLLLDFPIYTEFLKKVRGIGPALAGILVSEIDINKARYPSSLHKLAGLDVVIKPQPDVVADIDSRLYTLSSHMTGHIIGMSHPLKWHVDSCHALALKEMSLYEKLYRSFIDNVGSGRNIIAAAQALCDFKNELSPINPFLLTQNDDEGRILQQGNVCVADLTASPKLSDHTLHLMNEVGLDPAPYYEWLHIAKELMTANKVEGRGRSATHLVETEYVDSHGEVKTKMGLTFKPVLKKTLYLLSTSFIKLRNPTYEPVYRDYRARLEVHPKWADKTKAHKHLASIRYTSKIFLNDLYSVWRTLENLPVKASWEVAKLGYSPHHGIARPNDWFKHQDII